MILFAKIVAVAIGVVFALLLLQREGYLHTDQASTEENAATRLRTIVPRVELDDPSKFKGALVLKTEKIIYCPVQKVASSEWLKVFRWVDRQDNWEQPKHKKHGLDYLSAMPLEDANDLLNSPEWLKFVVVREPAERLLSCFLQKCNKNNVQQEYINCPYLDIWPDLFQGEAFPDGTPSSPNDETLEVITAAFNEGREALFPQYVAVITRRVKKNPCSQNPHWAPQWCHCSLDVTAPVYNVVGSANMTAAAITAITPVVSSPERAEQIAQFLEHRMGSNHDRDGKKTSARKSAAKKYTEVMLRAVHDAYDKDYTLFSQYWEQ